MKVKRKEKQIQIMTLFIVWNWISQTDLKLQLNQRFAEQKNQLLNQFLEDLNERGDLLISMEQE